MHTKPKTELPKTPPLLPHLTMSQDDKDWILNNHNEVRNKLGSGQEDGQPSASNMNYLVNIKINNL